MDHNNAKEELPGSNHVDLPVLTKTRRMMNPVLANLLALATLALVGIALFLPHWLGQGTFVGDADRINTWLNIRKHTVDSIRAHGRVSTWNDRMFCGYPTSGLHWMVPELDVFGYLQARLPEGCMFHVCGYISCFFLIGAGWSFFSVARAFRLEVYPSTVGACLYMMGSFAINRIAQVDWAFAVLIAIPLGILILKRIQPGNWMSSFLLLAALCVFLIVFTFLQEVVYVFLFFGLFAVFQSVREKTWAPGLLFGAAFAVAFVIGLPRLVTVYEDFCLLDRGDSFHTTNTLEFLRWFNDGIFGRFPEEAWSMGNAINLHEGFQFYSTTFAALLLTVGAVRFGNWSTTITRAIFFSVATLVFWTILEGPRLHTCLWLLFSSYAAVSLSAERTRLLAAVLMAVFCLTVFRFASTNIHYLLGIYFGLLALGLAWKKAPIGGGTFDDRDVLFFYLVVSLCMTVVLFPTARYIVYSIFFRIDFTHSRILIAALVPMNLLVAYLLQSLFCRPDIVAQPRQSVHWQSLVLGMALGALSLACMNWGREACELFFSAGDRLPLLWSLQLYRREALHVLVAIGVFCLFLLGLRLGRTQESRRHALAYGFGTLLVTHCFANASFQITGPQTWTYPSPFRANNYVMAPREAFHDPTQDQESEAHRLLETEYYRTAFIAHPQEFSAFVEPHMAHFWNLRVMGGYSAGVPKHLAGLPWPDGVRQPRNLSFPDGRMINWQLLAFLNTKYVVVLNEDFYYNLKAEAGIPAPGYHFDHLTVTKNPVDVVPRVFFTRLISPPNHDPTVHIAQDRSLPKPNLYLTIESPKVILVQWQDSDQDLRILVEMREPNQTSFRPIAEMPVAGRALLAPGGRYIFRAFLLRGETRSEPSAEVGLDFETVDLPKPKNVRAERISKNEVRVSWATEAGCTYVLEQAGKAGAFVPIRVGVSPPVMISEAATNALGFRVRAVNDGHTSPHAEPAWSAPSGVSPEDIALVQAMFPYDPRVQTIVKGLDRERTFPVTGVIKSHFRGDRIFIDVNREAADRFLVLNESYHPRWQARCDGQSAEIFPVNAFMRGLVVPAGTTRIELEYVPFSHTPVAFAISSVGLALGLFGGFVIRRLSQRLRTSQVTAVPSNEPQSIEL